MVAAAAGKGFGKPAAKGGDAKAPAKCGCGSGKPYESCCGRYHSGAEPAPTPEALLRSRFTAYRMQLIDYLVATTHPKNPEHTGDEKTYKRSVQRTARANSFLSLTVCMWVCGRGVCKCNSSAACFAAWPVALTAFDLCLLGAIDLRPSASPPD